MKESFPHDYHASSDKKIRKLIYEKGWEGYGLYWGIVELMYQQGGEIDATDIETYAFMLRCKTECLQSILNDYALFKIEGNTIKNKRIAKRLVKNDRISATRSKSARIKWLNHYAKVMQMHMQMHKSKFSESSQAPDNKEFKTYAKPNKKNPKLLITRDFDEKSENQKTGVAGVTAILNQALNSDAKNNDTENLSKLKEERKEKEVTRKRKERSKLVDQYILEELVIKEKEINKEKENKPTLVNNSIKPEKKLRNIIPPPKKELVKYIQENHYPVDPAMFYNFYESKGWVVGKVRMIDWQAAVRTWVQKRKTETPGESIPPPPPRKDVSTTDAEARGILEHLKGKRIGKE